MFVIGSAGTTPPAKRAGLLAFPAPLLRGDGRRDEETESVCALYASTLARSPYSLCPPMSVMVFGLVRVAVRKPRDSITVDLLIMADVEGSYSNILGDEKPRLVNPPKTKMRRSPFGGDFAATAAAACASGIGRTAFFVVSVSIEGLYSSTHVCGPFLVVPPKRYILSVDG